MVAGYITTKENGTTGRKRRKVPTKPGKQKGKKAPLPLQQPLDSIQPVSSKWTYNNNNACPTFHSHRCFYCFPSIHKTRSARRRLRRISATASAPPRQNHPTSPTRSWKSNRRNRTFLRRKQNCRTPTQGRSSTRVSVVLLAHPIPATHRRRQYRIPRRNRPHRRGIHQHLLP